MIDSKEYARQMRENAYVENGIIKVSEELWLQIADMIDNHAQVQTINNNDSEFIKFLWENMQPNEMEQWQEMFRTRNDKSEPTFT